MFKYKNEKYKEKVTCVCKGKNIKSIYTLGSLLFFVTHSMAKREVPLKRISETQLLSGKDLIHLETEVQQVKLFLMNHFKSLGVRVHCEKMAKWYTFKVTYNSSPVPYKLKDDTIAKYHPHLTLEQDMNTGCDIFKLEFHEESQCQISEEVNANMRVNKIEREKRMSRINKWMIKIIQLLLTIAVFAIVYALLKMVKPNKY